ADYYYINSDEAATAIIVYKLVKELGVPLTREIAQPLYAGIVGDTGGFRHSNTTQEVLMIAGELVGAGAQPEVTAREIFESKPLNFIQLLGFALSRIQQSAQGKIVWIALAYEDFQRYQIDPADSDQIIQFARMVAGAEIIILFREVQP